jgi:sugar phosphate isomerase/epimerase
VVLGLETTLSAEANRDLVERIDSPAVGIYHDVGNPLGFDDDPAEMVRKYGESMAQLHFKDQDDDGEWAMLGQGNVDFEAVTEAVAEIDYDGWIVVETKGPETDLFAEARKNLEFARAAFQSTGTGEAG